MSGNRSRQPRTAAEAWRWQALVEAAADLAYDDALVSSIFAFARLLRSWEWSGAQPTGEHVARYIEDCFVKYGPAPGDVWEALGLDCRSGDPRAEFIGAFDAIRVPAGMGVWEAAQRNASTRPFVPAVVLSRKYVQFVSLAGHLQRARAPGQRIFLPVARLASMLGVTPQMISKYRREAIRAGILRPVRAASRDERRATEFVFNLDAFDADGRQRNNPSSS